MTEAEANEQVRAGTRERSEVRADPPVERVGGGAGSPDLAIVFCVHHKPWLMMSTLLAAR